MIELTDQQRKELGNGEPVRVLDPATRTQYVLVRADVHASLRQLLEQGEHESVQEAWADAVEETHSEMSDA